MVRGLGDVFLGLRRIVFLSPPLHTLSPHASTSALPRGPILSIFLLATPRSAGSALPYASAAHPTLSVWTMWSRSLIPLSSSPLSAREPRHRYPPPPTSATPSLASSTLSDVDVAPLCNSSKCGQSPHVLTILIYEMSSTRSSKARAGWCPPRPTPRLRLLQTFSTNRGLRYTGNTASLGTGFQHISCGGYGRGNIISSSRKGLLCKMGEGGHGGLYLRVKSSARWWRCLLVD